MPELPDITVYLDRLRTHVQGHRLQRIVLLNPFLLRTATPAIVSAEGRQVIALRRIGKRIVFALEGDLFLVLHLMIAGRLRWLEAGKRPPGRISLAVFEFDSGRLLLTEAGSKRRASLHLVAGETALAAIDPGGLDVLHVSLADFTSRLQAENHTVKRALTDPHLFSGIGNAYSDEILHRARLSPLALTQQMSAADIERLHHAVKDVLVEWAQRLDAQAGPGFPAKVTAFHDEMAVHGRHGKPCPVCGAPVQRIVYAENETNYCARCQTGGRILADRALSRLLKKTFPRSIDELE